MRLCLLFSLFFLLTVQPDKSAYGQTNSNRAAQQPSSSAAPNESPVNQPRIENVSGPIQHPEGESEKPKPVTRAEKIQIGINVLLFFVVLWQTAIYIQQRNTMRTQVDNARISERAYIGIKAVRTVDQVLGKIPVVQVTVVNAGRTPAWKLKAPARIALGTEFPEEKPEVSKAESPSILAANGETVFSYPFPFALTPQWVAHMRARHWTVFLHMETHFFDCWGEPQSMTFKLAYRTETDTWGDYKDKGEITAKWEYVTDADAKKPPDTPKQS